MSSNIQQIFVANPTTTFVSNDLMYLGRSPYGAADDFAFTYSSLIPINIKGDIFTWGSAATRLAVGANGTLLQANSGTTTGLQYTTATYPTTTTINQLLYSSSNNVLAGIATGNNGTLITSAGGVPSISSTLPSAVQGNITALGTIASGVWQGTAVSYVYGGTGQTTYALGDTLYASATDVLSKLAGNTTTDKQFLSQTGNGAISSAPVWEIIDGSDINGTALIAANGTNVTLTMSGLASTCVLTGATITAGWTGTLAMNLGGSGRSLTANNGGIVYTDADSMEVLAGTATANRVLLSGSSSAPAWSTATYPATTTVSQILYSSATNTVTGLATANSAMLVTNSSGVPVMSGTMTNGQLIIGSTSGTPTAGTLTAGTGITITNGAGSITINSTGGFTVVNVTGTSASMAVSSRYIANNGSLVTLTLPTTAAVGDEIQIRGSGAGLWIIAQNASQIIHVGSLASTTGVGGSVAATNRYDCLTLTCIVANNEFVVSGAQGNFTTV